MNLALTILAVAVGTCLWSLFCYTKGYDRGVLHTEERWRDAVGRKGAQ